MLDAIHWDTDLLRRYAQTGPRYVSYPSVEHFHSGIGSFELLHALRESRKARRPLSLYVHLPFCANSCYHCSRNRLVSKDRGRTSSYLQHLEKEIELLSCHLDPKQRVEQLHVGGGTPTFLNHGELRRLLATLRQHFNLRSDDAGDYGIEIDPRETDWSTMGLLRELGFNRASIGLQDLDPQVQQAINRLQSLEQTRTIVEAARTLQFRSITIDLSYGLPRQTPEGFARTLDAVLALQPDRLSLFNYAHQPARFQAQRRINPDELPSAQAKLTMLHNSITQLQNAGYRYLGMEHFALADDELASAQEDGTLQRNYRSYSTHGHYDLLGLGVSAISQIGDLYSQNSSDLAAYQQSLANGQLSTCRGLLCNADDRLRRSVIQQLICTFGVEFADLEKQFNIDFAEYFSALWPQLRQMAADGLLDLSANGLRMRPAGRLLTRAVCRLFDHYLPVQPPQQEVLDAQKNPD